MTEVDEKETNTGTEPLEQGIILNVRPTLPVEAKTMLDQGANRIIEAARDDIRILIQERQLERKHAQE